ncbi:MAG: hypothetical protein R3C11_19485 [Planctomycetaceae bacterium]
MNSTVEIPTSSELTPHLRGGCWLAARKEQLSELLRQAPAEQPVEKSQPERQGETMKTL